MGRAGIKLATPGCAIRLASVVRHSTDCATWPSVNNVQWILMLASELKMLKYKQLFSDQQRYFFKFIAFELKDLSIFVRKEQSVYNPIFGINRELKVLYVTQVRKGQFYKGIIGK